jgi:hypothetical protein
MTERQTVRTPVGELYVSDFEGAVDDTIRHLKRLKGQYGPSITLKMRQDRHTDEYYLAVLTARLETDIEVAKRLEKERIQAETTQRQERELYERLKARLEGTAPA